MEERTLNRALTKLFEHIKSLKDCKAKNEAVPILSRIRNVVIHNRKENLLIPLDAVIEMSELFSRCNLSYVNFMFVLKEEEPNIFLPIYSPLIVDKSKDEKIICPCCFREVGIACSDINKEYAYAPHFRHKERHIKDCLFSTHSSADLRKGVNLHSLRIKGEKLKKSFVCDKERVLNIAEKVVPLVSELIDKNTYLKMLMTLDDMGDIFPFDDSIERFVIFGDKEFNIMRIKKETKFKIQKSSEDFDYFENLFDSFLGKDVVMPVVNKEKTKMLFSRLTKDDRVYTIKTINKEYIEEYFLINEGFISETYKKVK